MTLFINLLPLYILGNLHCLGMCGPMLVLLGQNKYRYFYFLGRVISYGLAGWFAGELGGLINALLKSFHLSAATSFLCGTLFLAVGIIELTGYAPPLILPFQNLLARFSRSLSVLLLKDQPWPAFLFGFFTLFLPCGQTLLVFTACALYGDGLVGFLNGMAFALLTSPSLIAAMQLHAVFSQMKKHYRLCLGCCALLVAALSICRGMAEMEWIPHLIISETYHIVIY